MKNKVCFVSLVVLIILGVITISYALWSHSMEADKSNLASRNTENEESNSTSVNIENQENKEEEKTYNHMTETDKYMIYVHGEAEASEDEINYEEAVELGMEYLKSIGYQYKEQDNKLAVDMIYLDSILGFSSSWSMKVRHNDENKYELTIEAATGEILSCVETMYTDNES